MPNNKTGEQAIFGGGCFWCTEAVFKMLKGVTKVLPGYASKEEKLTRPSYEEVGSGRTSFVEVVYIEFNPEEVSYKDLLTVLFASHDPTSLNRQGNDVGTQYRSVIFYYTPVQEKETYKFIAELNASNPKGRPIVTSVEPLGSFFEAEDYHKNYYSQNMENPYCELVINPKLEKVQQKFAQLLKSN